MQHETSAVSSLPENLSFDHGSTSDDVIDQHMSWNIHLTSAQDRLPNYSLLSNDSNISYQHHPSSSSVQNQVTQNERRIEHGGPSTIRVRQGAALTLGQRHEESNIFSLDNVELNLNSNQSIGEPYLIQSSSSHTLPQDPRINSEIDSDDDDDCQVVERSNTFKSIVSSNEQLPSSGTSSDLFMLASGSGGHLVEEGDGGPGCLDGHRLLCKRKTLEGNTGQSSGDGSSNNYRHTERSLCHALPGRPNTASSISMPMPSENHLAISDARELQIPRIGVGVEAAASASPLGTPFGSAESSGRNCRLRISGSLHQHSVLGDQFPSESDNLNIHDLSSRNSSRLHLHDHLFDFSPASPAENGSAAGQSVLSHVPSVNGERHAPSNSSTSSSSGNAISGELDPMPYEEPRTRNIPRNSSRRPRFLPASEAGSSSQNDMNWGVAGGSGNMGIAGTDGTSLRTGSIINSSAAAWSYRSPVQHPSRISEIVRRSVLSRAGLATGQRNNDSLPGSSSSTASLDMPSGSDSHGPHLSSSRMLLERHFDGAIGVPYSMRTLSVAREGRSRLVSEIRNVLDLMRRGEDLRLEDVMVLDQSVFFGIADVHDRHRDMRLDVDNMSYEELLALEERIGNVCTGLTEETITSQLKQHKYVDIGLEGQVEMEPCSICREEYNGGEDLGTLECGHDFHTNCIKQWLMQKNLCPICKTTGLSK